jgi:4-hydroxybenzoate polyprenyltransferase/phosphoserine phosphatase
MAALFSGPLANRSLIFPALRKFPTISLMVLPGVIHNYLKKQTGILKSAASAHMPEQAKNLILDLDGTLLRTDSLWELASLAVAEGHILSLLWLVFGRAALKRRLAQVSSPDLSLMPWNEEVVNLAREARARGVQVWLATGADEILARKVADHFGFFTGVLASDGHINLIAEAKAGALAARFGPRLFDYCGDSAADLPVWKICREALIVNPSPRLLARLERVSPLIRRLDKFAYKNFENFEKLEILGRAIRLKQWLKNVLVAVPLLLAHKFTWPAAQTMLAAFFLFSLCASALYLFNDILDLADDRRHPVKRKRPLASGALSVPLAFLMAGIFLFFSFWGSLKLAPGFTAVLAFYVILTLAYFFIFKKMLIADNVCLGLLYTFRLIAGAEALEISISIWLLTFSFSIFIGLSFVKRLIEIRRGPTAGESNLPGRGYRFSEGRLIETMSVSSGFISVVILALYIESAQALRWYANPRILWAICPIILYWYCRLLMLVGRGEIEYDPVAFVSRDRISLLCGLIAMALILLAI